MIKLALALMSILLSTYLSFYQKQEKSPMYYKGIDAGMTPEETTKILGKPDSIDVSDSELLHLYMLEDGRILSLNFYKKRWLCEIHIIYYALFNYSEFGLTSDGGQGFKTEIIDERNKIWRKTFSTKQFGKIIITYRNKPGNTSLINIRAMKVVDPSILKG